MENSLIHSERPENEHHTPLIASDRVEGTSLYSPSGDKVGNVDHLMIDKVSGQVEYAVITFGGFLGVGTKKYPLPWNKLDYDTKLEGYVSDVTAQTLENAPSFDAEKRPEYSANDYARVSEFYGVG